MMNKLLQVALVASCIAQVNQVVAMKGSVVSSGVAQSGAKKGLKVVDATKFSAEPDFGVASENLYEASVSQKEMMRPRSNSFSGLSAKKPNSIFSEEGVKLAPDNQIEAETSLALKGLDLAVSSEKLNAAKQLNAGWRSLKKIQEPVSTSPEIGADDVADQGQMQSNHAAVQSALPLYKLPASFIAELPAGNSAKITVSTTQPKPKINLPQRSNLTVEYGADQSSISIEYDNGESKVITLDEYPQGKLNMAPNYRVKSTVRPNEFSSKIFSRDYDASGTDITDALFAQKMRAEGVKEFTDFAARQFKKFTSIFDMPKGSAKNAELKKMAEDNSANAVAQSGADLPVAEKQSIARKTLQYAKDLFSGKKISRQDAFNFVMYPYDRIQEYRLSRPSKNGFIQVKISRDGQGNKISQKIIPINEHSMKIETDVNGTLIKVEKYEYDGSQLLPRLIERKDINYINGLESEKTIKTFNFGNEVSTQTVKKSYDEKDRLFQEVDQIIDKDGKTIKGYLTDYQYNPEGSGKAYQTINTLTGKVAFTGGSYKENTMSNFA